MNTAASKNVTEAVQAKWWSDTQKACKNSGKPGARRGWLRGDEGSPLQPPCCMRYKQEGGPPFFFLMTQHEQWELAKSLPKFFGSTRGRGDRGEKGGETGQETKINSTTKASVSSAPGFFFIFYFSTFFKSHLWSTEAASVLDSINQLVTGSDFIGG